MDVSKFFDALKLAPRVLFGVALASGIAVFSPPWLVEMLGFQALLQQSRGWIGATFLVSSALFVSALLATLADYYGPLVRERAQIRSARHAMKHLSRPEKEVLATYLQQDTTTLTWEITNGCVRGLEAKGILYRASSMGRGTAFDFNLQPWAWMHLSKHPELVRSDPELSGDPVQRRELR